MKTRQMALIQLMRHLKKRYVCISEAGRNNGKRSYISCGSGNPLGMVPDEIVDWLAINWWKDYDPN